MRYPGGLALILAFLVFASCGARPERDAAPERGDRPKETVVRPETTTNGNATATGEDLGPRLISAAERGDVRTVGSLLDRGAGVRARDADGRTALIAASYGNHLGTAELLVEAGADVNAKDDTVQSSYLISTSEVGDDPRLLELTLQNGADVGSLDSYNGTGLIRAAERGHPRIVERLLRTDIAVDHVNNLGWTALLEAIILGDGGPAHTETVRLLVQRGNADPNLPDGEGTTPLQHARQNGHAEIAEILTDAGAR